MKKYYLCFMYSHRFRIVRWWRWYKSIRLTARVLKRYPGAVVFNPVGHSHPVSLFLGNGMSHDFWLKQDFSFLDDWAGTVLIPMDEPAWKKSKGIALEKDRFDGPIRWVKNSGEII